MPVKDASAALVHMLEQSFGDCRVTFLNVHSHKWASGGFLAVQHLVVLTISGTHAPLACAAFLQGLREREFDLGRYILADISARPGLATTREIGLTIDALTTNND